MTGSSASTAFTSVGLQYGQTIGTAAIVDGNGSAATASVGNYHGTILIGAATGGTFQCC